MATTARGDCPHSSEVIAAEAFAQDVWGYVRQHKNSLDSKRHIGWIENKACELINICDHRAIAIEKKYKALAWFVDNSNKNRRMFRKNMTRFEDRNKAYDAEVCYAVQELGATIAMAAKVFHTSNRVIREILQQNGCVDEETAYLENGE